jgi:hypothetical protein
LSNFGEGFRESEMLHKKFPDGSGSNADNFEKRLSVNMGEISQKGTGSRYSDGNVPNVNWNDDSKMNVNWYNPDNRNDNLRSRQKFQKEIR